jgi:hypothetical protein
VILHWTASRAPGFNPSRGREGRRRPQRGARGSRHRRSDCPADHVRRRPPDIGFGDGFTPNLIAVLKYDQEKDDFASASGGRPETAASRHPSPVTSYPPSGPRRPRLLMACSHWRRFAGVATRGRPLAIRPPRLGHPVRRIQPRLRGRASKSHRRILPRQLCAIRRILIDSSISLMAHSADWLRISVCQRVTCWVFQRTGVDITTITILP